MEKKKVRCPLCGTVIERRVAEDKWFVEGPCTGILKLEVKEDEETTILEFECPYWWCGFE